MAIFYHISTDLNHSGLFEPRIPINRHQDAEDDTIERICISPSIEDCLTAIPNGGFRLADLNEEREGLFLVFKIDTEKLGISKYDIITAEELYQRDLVRDSAMTEEHWITTAFQVPQEDRFIIKLTEWDEDVFDVIPYEIVKLADELYEGDYCKAYMETYDELVPSSINIVNARYFSEKVKEGDRIEYFINDDLILKLLKEHISGHYAFEILKEDENQLDLIAKKDMSIQGLFLYQDHLMRTYGI